MPVSKRATPFLRPLLRGLPLIALAVIGCVLAARWYLQHAVPMYESTAKIRLADPHDGGPSANLYKDFDVFATNNQIGTEVEMVKARVLIEKTLDSMEMQTTVYRIGKLKKMELYHDNPLLVEVHLRDTDWYGRPIAIDVLPDSGLQIKGPGEPKSARGCFGQWLTLRGADILVRRNDSLLRERTDLPLMGRYAVVKDSRDQAVDKITGNLDITSIDKDVPILRIIYKSAVPEKAADYVNILANTYISDYVATKVRAADLTVDFLDRQLAEVAARLRHSEDTIEDYRNDKNIINIHQETETDLRKIAQLKIQQANLQMSLAAIDSLDVYIQKGKENFLELAPNFEAFTDLLSTEIVKKIKQLQSDKKDLLLQYTEKDGKVVAIDEKITDLTSYLAESIRNSRKNYAIKYEEINRAISDAEKVFTGLPGREKSMTILERNFGLNEKIYSYLHQKRTEAQIARAATISFHRIVARGEAPEKPVSPNKVVIIAVSAILGLLGSAGGIFMVHNAKAKVNDAATIEKNSNTPLAAEVRVFKKEADRRRHFNDLATQLLLKNVVGTVATVVVSCYEREEGGAFIAANLSRSLAAQGRKVLLIDVDGGIAAPPGVDHYQAREETMDGVVIRTQLAEKLDSWRKVYDLLLISNQPVTESANALVYMSLATTNLFVLDARRTAARTIQEADLLGECFSLPGWYFILNRAHYNPSVWREFRIFKKARR